MYQYVQLYFFLLAECALSVNTEIGLGVPLEDVKTYFWEESLVLLLGLLDSLGGQT